MIKRLRPGIVVLFCAGSAAAALAAEPSIVDQASRAFETAVDDATGAAASAAKALTASGAKRKQSASRNKSQDDKATASDPAKDAGPSEAVEAETTGLPLPVRKPKGARTLAQTPPADAAHHDHGTDGADAKASDSKPADAKSAAAPPPKAPELTEWPAVDIELAKARCTRLLKDLDVVTVPEAPFRKGPCGAPAPVRLVSIGKNPEVAVSPPALVTCDMVFALHKWVTGDVQPLAKKYMDAPVVKIETMSDYACRNAYGRVGNKLSEHGKVNALDIRGFVTAKAKTAYVLEEWGETKRDVVARIAAKDAADKALAAKAATDEKSAEAKTAVAERADAKADVAADAAAKPVLAKTTIIDGMPKLTITLPSGGSERTAAAGAPSLSVAPRHLGGPKDSKDKAGKEQTAAVDPGPAAPAPLTKTSHFLHEAHDAACRIFGTTLGPEANNDHRNHFHVDMAERKVTKICD